MPERQGSSTAVIKVGAEAQIFYHFGAVEKFGKCVAGAATSGTLTAESVSPLDQTNGSDVVIRARKPFASATATVVTLTGTDKNDAALTGTATFPAYCGADQAYDVQTTAAAGFKTIASYSTTGATSGDSFDIVVMPDLSSSGDRVLIEFDKGLTINPGLGVESIVSKENVLESDHTKTTYGERTATISDDFMNSLSGIHAIRNREVTMLILSVDDTGDAVTESWVISKFRCQPTREIPGELGGHQTVSAEAAYGAVYAFA